MLENRNKYTSKKGGIMTGIYRIVAGFGKVAMADTQEEAKRIYNSFPKLFRSELVIEHKISDEGIMGEWEKVKI